MLPVWLIEAGVYGSEADSLLAEIRRQGMIAEAVPFQAILKEKHLIAVAGELASKTREKSQK